MTTRDSTRSTAGWIGAVLLLTLLVVIPGNAVLPSHAPAPSPHNSARASGLQLVASAPPEVRSAGTYVGLGGHLFHEVLSSPDGTNAYTIQQAYDPTTGTVYSANLYQGITAFSASTGSEVAVQTFTNVYSPNQNYAYGVAVDPATGRVFASVLNITHAGSAILVLNAGTLAIEQKVAFPGIRGATFYPGYLTWDPTTHRLFVQNTSADLIAVFSGSPLAFASWVTLPVGLPGLARASLEATTYPQLLLPVYNATLYEVNTTSYAVHAFQTLTYPGTELISAAYDPHNNLVWAGNYSPSGHGYYWTFNASTGLYVTGWWGAQISQDPRSLLYLPGSESLVVANDSAAETVDVLNVSGATPTFGTAYVGSGYAYYSGLVADPTTGGFFAAATAVVAQPIQLLSDAPVSLVRSYSAFPFYASSPVVDSGAGLAYLAGQYPSELTAVHLSDGTVAWNQSGVRIQGNIGTLAADPLEGKLYAVAASGVSLSEYSPATGAFLTSISLATAGYIYHVAVDRVHHYLYVMNYTNVYVYSTRTDTLLANVSVGTMESSAGLTPDPVRGRAWVFTYGPGIACGNYTEVDPLNGTSARVINTESCPFATTLAGNGDLWTSYASNNISELSPATGKYIANVTTPGIQAAGIAYDPQANLVAYGSFNNSYLGFVNSTSDAFVGNWAAPGSMLQLAYDANASTLATVSYTSDQILLLEQVYAPASPSGVAALGGNGTLTVSWTAPTSTGGANITGYNVSIGTSATGPWTSTVATSLLTHTFTGLTLGTKYYSVVTASNAAGTSAPSTPVSGTPAAVPYPPTGVALTVLSSTRIGVAWANPASTGGSTITNFSVEYASAAAGPWTTLSAGAGNNATLTGLAASTTYYVRVVAWNGIGSSAPSATASAATKSTAGGASNGVGSLSGLDWAFIAIVIVLVIGGIVAAMMMRRRKGGSTPPPAGPPASVAPTAPAASPPAWSETPESPGSPPPGAM